jgi:hypothetical protein
MAAGGGFVYWSLGNSNSSLWRVPADGGCATQVLTGEIGGAGYSTMVADGTNLYWSQWAKTVTGIYKMPLSGGTPTLLYDDGTAFEYSPPIAVGATSVYFWRTATSSTPISLMQVPIAGGTPTEVVTMGVDTTGLSPQGDGLAADANNVYWWDPSEVVDSVPAAGGQVSTLASGQNANAERGLVASGGWVYLMASSGLVQMPAGGGAVTVFPGTRIFDPAVDASHVYWIVDDGQGHGAIQKMPLGGGPVSVVVSLDMGIDCPGAFAVDETNVYWSCGTFENLIMAAPKGP